MKVFLDANILFSAARAGSAVERVLSELAAGGVLLVTSQHAVEEARPICPPNARATCLDWSNGWPGWRSPR